MRLNENEITILEQVNSAEEIIYALKSFGYVFASQGSFSYVYLRGESAVKVCHAAAHEDGALLYLEWLRDTKPDNPAFPHVYHVWRKEDATGRLTAYIAEMEALEPATMEAFSTYDRQRKHMRAAIYGNSWTAHVEGDIDVTLPEVQAAQAIRAKFDGIASFDLHEHNWMLRGTQPVITDPLAYRRDRF